MTESTVVLIRLPEVKKITGLPRSSVYDKMQRKEFPSSVSLGRRTVAWVASEVQSWIEDRIRASRGSAQ